MLLFCEGVASARYCYDADAARMRMIRGDRMEVPEPIRAVVQAWDDAYEAADGDGLAALYEESGVLWPATGSRVAGRAAIAAYLRARLPLPAREQPRIGPRKFFFFPPLVHAAATATGRHGEKHSVLDILVRQADGSYLFACSSWTFK
jgi:uncharacterized protein (TIGR02246 family)